MILWQLFKIILKYKISCISKYLVISFSQWVYGFNTNFFSSLTNSFFYTFSKVGVKNFFLLKSQKITYLSWSKSVPNNRNIYMFNTTIEREFHSLSLYHKKIIWTCWYKENVNPFRSCKWFNGKKFWK